jgi:hypothetical protein
MKSHGTGKALHWFTVPPVTRSPIDDDRQFGFDPDFIVPDDDGSDAERDVLFDPDPALTAGGQRRIWTTSRK